MVCLLNHLSHLSSPGYYFYKTQLLLFFNSSIRVKLYTLKTNLNIEILYNLVYNVIVILGGSWIYGWRGNDGLDEGIGVGSGYLCILMFLIWTHNPAIEGIDEY